MIYLLLSILSSVSIFVVFKLLETRKVPLLPTILINYATCVVLGLLFIQPDLLEIKEVMQQTWFLKSLSLGALFVAIFLAMALTTAHFGISTTSVASKMAMVVPVVYFLAIEGNQPTWFFWIGLVLSFPAIFLLTFSGLNGNKKGFLIVALPILVWFGSGVIDTVLKILETEAIDFKNKTLWISTLIFSGALVAGLILLIFRTKERKFPASVFKMGVLLGIPNFFSIWFLLLALSLSKFSPSVLFPVNNVGIVAVSVLVSKLFFGEIITPKRAIGFVMAILSFVLLSF